MNFDTNLPFEWFILLLRILLVFLLYFFLFQIVRTITRELRAVSLATSGARPLMPEEAPRATAQLVVEDAQEAGYPPGAAFTLRPGATIGRRASSDLHFNDTFMSGEHARVTLQEGCWWLADLGSTNGTFVNGHRIDRPTPLADGAEVRFGRIRPPPSSRAQPRPLPVRSMPEKPAALRRVRHASALDLARILPTVGGAAPGMGKQAGKVEGGDWVRSLLDR